MKRKIFIFFMILFIINCSNFKKTKVEDYNEYAYKLVKQSLYKEALFYLEKAEEKDESNYKILNNLAICYEALGLKKKAEKYYKKAYLKNKNIITKKNYEDFKKNN